MQHCNAVIVFYAREVTVLMDIPCGQRLNPENLRSAFITYHLSIAGYGTNGIPISNTSVSGGGNRSTRRKPPHNPKSLATFSHAEGKNLAIDDSIYKNTRLVRESLIR